MEIQLPPHRVHTLNTRLLHHTTNNAVRMTVVDENRTGRLPYFQLSKLSDNPRMQRHNRLTPIFRRFRTNEEMRKLSIKLQVIPDHLMQLANTKTRVCRNQIQYPVISSMNQQARKLVIAVRATLTLLAAYIDPIHTPKRINGNTPVPFHPVEQGTNAIQILVQSLRSKSLLLRTPMNKAIAGNIDRSLPVALLEKLRRAASQNRNVTLVASLDQEIGRELLKMLSERHVCRIPLKLGSDNTSTLPLPFLDYPRKFFLGNLLVTRAKSYIRCHEFAV